METNFGYGYTKKLVFFTTPSKSVYAFSGTIHAGSSGAYRETAAVLTQNGAAKGSIYADKSKMMKNLPRVL